MNVLLLFNTVEPGDDLVTILFTLFVASTVNERIIDFIKLCFPVLWLKSFNQREELQRHQRLWLLAFGMGVVTATLVDINLLTVLTERYSGTKLVGLLETIGDKADWPITLFGYVFTAVFLSLGSKFWHDLLDLVLFVKNSKRKIEDFDPVGVTKIEQATDFYQADEYDMAQRALEANRKSLEEKYKYEDVTFAVGYEHFEKEYRLCITIFHRGQKNTVPSNNSSPSPISIDRFNGNISYTSSNGYVFNFPLFIIHPGQVLIADSPIEAGGGLFNTATKNNVGTFGCVVKDRKDGCEDLLLLTCYHCVKAPEHKWEKFDPISTKKEVQYLSHWEDKNPLFVGEILAGYRHHLMDIAIIRPSTKGAITDYRWFPHKTVPLGSRGVTLEDVKKRTQVWFSGARSGNRKGYIINIGISEPVKN